MPWMLISYEIDLALFGLNASLFYLHHLLALAAAAIALFFLLQLWVKRTPALFSAVLFLAGAPSLVVSQQLMTRHYVEGLIFSILSLYCFVSYLRGKRLILLAMSVVLYLLAVVSKEIYVPLAVLLLFIPESNLRRRITSALPFFGIVICYALWRRAMLGSFGGGYVELADIFTMTFLSRVASSFLSFPTLLFGSVWPTLVAGYVVLLCFYYFHERVLPVVPVIVAGLILAPMIPLVVFPGIVVADRYLLLFWVALCFSVAIYGAHLFRFLEAQHFRPAKIVTTLCCALALGLSYFSGARVASTVVATGQQFDVHAAFIWENSGDVSFMPSPGLLSSYWFITDLSALKSRLFSGASSPISIVDPIYLEPGTNSLYVFNPECSCFNVSSESPVEIRAALDDALDPDAALEFSFAYQNRQFSWSFGPYDEGVYHVVSNVAGVFPAPRTGNLAVILEDNTPLILRYTSPSGWTTYSDELFVVEGAPAVVWERVAPVD